uniref:Nucleolar protein 6 n=1 Tax=Glossina austeni TaxID=7395 RepID=A0A1A9VPE0_GLOAU
MHDNTIVGNASHYPNKECKPNDEELTNNKLKPPALEEINFLKDTCNLFRLQVLEMSSVDSMSWLKQSTLKVPLDLALLKVTKQKSFKFQYIQPNKDPFLIGAAAIHNLLGPQIQADICVVIPPQSFQKDDWFNMVYDQKRAYYLTYIAQQILKSKDFEDTGEENLKFNYYNNNPLEPLPVSKLSSKPSLLVVEDEMSFKLNRFVPWNNNIRLSLFDEEASDDSVPFTTPN